MLQALATAGEILTLPGSRWTGRSVTRDEAARLSTTVHCVSADCTQPMSYDSHTSTFRHSDWKAGCWQSKHHERSYEAHTVTWYKRQLIGEHSYRPASLAPAKVVSVRGGSSVAVRAVPVSAGRWAAPWRELRNAEKSHFASLWLVDDLMHHGELLGGWCQGFVRLALTAKLWPVSLGLVSSKNQTITFIGDVSVKTVQDRDEYVVASVSDPVSLEAFMWWTRNGRATPPPELAEGVRVIEQMTQRTIQLSS